MYEVRGWLQLQIKSINLHIYIKPFKVLSFKRYIPNITTPIYPRKARAIAIFIIYTPFNNKLFHTLGI